MARNAGTGAVNPAGEKVWQREIRQPRGDQNLYTVFMAKRVPE
jgi:hypothetical protein